MTDIAQKIKNTSQDFEAQAKTSGEHAESKPGSETLNKVKVKQRLFFYRPSNLHKTLNHKKRSSNYNGL